MPSDIIRDSNAAAQVFEVTNLTIPAGTNWSAGHELGTLTLDGQPGVLVATYLELAATPVDILQFAAFNVLNYNTFDYSVPATLGVQVALGGTDRWTGFIGVENLDDANHGFGLGPKSAPATFPKTLHVGFITSGPTTADIIVVRARAAFLVI